MGGVCYNGNGGNYARTKGDINETYLETLRHHNKQFFI